MLIKIRLPNNDKIIENIWALTDILDLIESSNNKEIVLDFSEVSWMPPCCIIIISNKILELKQKGIKFKWISPIKKNVAEHMKNLGFPLGTNIKEGSYVPPKHIIRDNSNKKKLGREINELLNEIIQKIPNNINGVSYILSELSDNIEDHSKYECASIMAQYFPTKKEVEIIVFDNGLTIPGVFSKNKISLKSDTEAIEKALSGEISTPKISKKEIGRGYGLKSCKSLSTESFKGEIYLFSRKGFVTSKYNKKNSKGIMKNPLKGTLICVKIKLPIEDISVYDKAE